MNPLEEKRIATYRKANDTVRRLYGDLELGEAMDLIAKAQGFSDAQKHLFIDVVGDIILGFYPKSDFSKLLVSEAHCSQNIADDIVGKLARFLTPIEETPATNLEPRERLDLRPEGVQQKFGGEESRHEEMAKPLTREELLSALSAKRTMATDIEAVRNKHAEKETEQKPVEGYAAFRENEEGKDV